MDLLPENLKNRQKYSPIDFKDITKGLYVSYVSKPYKYRNGKETPQSFKRGGYCSFINLDDSFLGLTNFGKMWSVQNDNVIQWYKSEITQKNKKNIENLQEQILNEREKIKKEMEKDCNDKLEQQKAEFTKMQATPTTKEEKLKKARNILKQKQPQIDEIRNQLSNEEIENLVTQSKKKYLKK